MIVSSMRLPVFFVGHDAQTEQEGNYIGRVVYHSSALHRTV